MSLSVLFHVNHLWGVGHFTRTAAIANAVVAAGGTATVIAGNRPVFGRVGHGVTLVTLPAVRSPDTRYAQLVDLNGYPVDQSLWERRGAIIADTVADASPDVLVTETFPFGRRKLAAEMLQMIGAAKAQHAKIVSSIRDLPTVPQDERRLAECANRLHAHYDAVLIHGDPKIVGLQDVWPGDIPVPALMTGYVAEQAAQPEAERAGVIVSAGGGGDSAALLLAAMEGHRSGLLAGEKWTFITGPMAPDDLFDTLTAQAGSGAEVLHTADDLLQRLARARLSISRGGYNTMVETIVAGTRAVIVPFAPDDEPEQRQRAQHFAAAELVQHLPEDALSAAMLSAACMAALAAPPPDASLLQFDGAAQSAALLARIASGG
jgi:predicted glycosyltransferase